MTQPRGKVSVTVKIHVRGVKVTIRKLKRAIRQLERTPQPLCIDGAKYRQRQRNRR